MKRLMILLLIAGALAFAVPIGAQSPNPTASARVASDSVAREKLDKVIDLTSRRYLSTERHSPWQIVHGIKAFGWQLELENGAGNRRVKAIDFLCRDARVGGRRIFAPAEHGLKVIDGTGMQGHHDQFLSAFAQAGLPLDYPLEIDDRQFSVGDLLEQAKYDYHAGQESTWTLIAFSTYIPFEAKWTNMHGDEFRVEDLVAAEVDVEPSRAACGGTHNLYALAYALNRFRDSDATPTGVWQQAAQKLDKYRQLTNSLQNRDGFTSSNFYRGGGSSSDPTTQMDTTGHTLEWLTLALSDDELDDEWVTRAVTALIGAFDRTSTQPVDCGPLYHATRALAQYRERRFGEPSGLIAQRAR